MLLFGLSKLSYIFLAFAVVINHVGAEWTIDTCIEMAEYVNLKYTTVEFKDESVEPPREPSDGLSDGSDDYYSYLVCTYNGPNVNETVFVRSGYAIPCSLGKTSTPGVNRVNATAIKVTCYNNA